MAVCIGIIIVSIASIIAGLFIMPAADKVLRRKYKQREEIWQKKHDMYFNFLAENDGKQPKRERKASDEEFIAAGWAEQQRHNYVHNLLTREHYALLCEEGFNFKNQSTLKDSSLFKTREEEQQSYTFPSSPLHRFVPWLCYIAAVAVITICACIGWNNPSGMFGSDFAVNTVFPPLAEAMAAAFLWFLVLLSITDLRAFIVPSEISRRILIPLSIIYSISFGGLTGAFNSLLGVIGYLAIFGLFKIISTMILKKPYAIGGGDRAVLFPVTIAVSASSAFNLAIVILVWAFSALIVLAILAVLKKRRLNESFAAVPYIMIGYIAAAAIPFVYPIFMTVPLPF